MYMSSVVEDYISKINDKRPWYGDLRSLGCF